MQEQGKHFPSGLSVLFHTKALLETISCLSPSHTAEFSLLAITTVQHTGTAQDTSLAKTYQDLVFYLPLPAPT